MSAANAIQGGFAAPVPARPSGPEPAAQAQAGGEARLRWAARMADTVMFGTLLISALAAVAMGWTTYELRQALIGAVVLVLMGSAAFVFARGTPLSAYILTLANVACVALHIQVTRGGIEFHFGVFVLLGLLLIYRDWRVLVFAAGLFAVHHVVFDRLQALNFGVYCTPEPDFARIVLHAVYVVVQTLVEIFLAVRLRAAAVEAAELLTLVARIDQGQAIGLALGQVPVQQPTAASLKTALLKVREAVQEVSDVAGQLGQTTGQIVQGSHVLHERTRQAANLQQTIDSMDEIARTVADTAHSAEQAKTLAQQASATATQGSEAVRRAASTMEDIVQSSSRIADITQVINGIAFQTNILALNASVESARAGEHGRGFAVVAAEVRQLAQRTTEAAREIQRLIGESGARVEAGRQLVGEARSGMDRIVEQTGDVSTLIQAISQAASRQTDITGQVSAVVSELDGVTRQSASFVEEISHCADTLQEQAGRLDTVVGRFILR
jgi:methyl-accepting chemotaxis protein